MPLVNTTVLDLISKPKLVRTPTILRSSTINPTTISCQKSRLSIPSNVCLHFLEKSIRSDCALGLHIAGPLDWLSILNCIMVSSVTTAEYPPRASISLIICPLATPPIAGLQDIWAMVSMFMVTKSVLAPRLAAAAAPSHPAWPAPTTITSYSFRNIQMVPRGTF